MIAVKLEKVSFSLHLCLDGRDVVVDIDHLNSSPNSGLKYTYTVRDNLTFGVGETTAITKMIKEFDNKVRLEEFEEDIIFDFNRS